MFTPYNADVVGVFDTETDTFSTHYTALTMTSKFRGATAVGTKVVFTPYNADVVGVYDTETDTYSTVNTGLTIGYKFRGATAVGTKVVFTPFNANKVGVFDTETDTFSPVDTTLTGTALFSGATAVGTKVVFAPFYADVVGVFDMATNKFSPVGTGLNMGGFGMAVAVGTKVVFSPSNNIVGVFDIETNTFSTHSIGQPRYDEGGGLQIGGPNLAGGIAVGTKVVFPPCTADVVGILDLSPSPTPPSNNENPDLGLIIGLTVGGAVVLGGLVYYFYFARVNKVQSPITFPFQKLVF